MYNTQSFTPENFKPSRFESDGKIKIKGKDLSFHTVCEDNVFYDEAGKPIASIFSYSYFRTGIKDPEKRPVLFAFNGGPGSSSKYLNSGFLAPWRIKYTEPIDRESSLPPYPVIDNPDCILDSVDIVVVDMIGVGYGLLIDPAKKEEFFGIEQDAEALLQFIEKWCDRYGRFNSPKYLFGESYGCTRAATAAGIATSFGKNRNYGVRFDGIILMGNTVSPHKYYFDGLPFPYAVLALPTYAAVHWYHTKPEGKGLKEFYNEAREFADHDYLLALYKGEALQGKEREDIKKRITYYTGASDEYLERHDLQIDQDSFRKEAIKDRGLVVGRCDARFTRPAYVSPMAEDDPNQALYDDAVMDKYAPIFYAVMNGTIAKRLGIKLERSYTPSKNIYPQWKIECEGGTTGQRLSSAMNMTFGMRCFFVNGYYDMCTEGSPVHYVLNHCGLPKDRCIFKNYPSGHMVYIGEDNVRELSADIRKFILHKKIEL